MVGVSLSSEELVSLDVPSLIKISFVLLESLSICVLFTVIMLDRDRSLEESASFSELIDEVIVSRSPLGAKSSLHNISRVDDISCKSEVCSEFSWHS